ncbi:MAG TPA: glycosyltransferase family 2 protein [Candidatus Kapabacteria bacterium]|nr:glycosyltransferase family 2 protein [Candidatus Kapabacteria bacterium]
MKLLISVVTFNRLDLLMKLLNSLRNQTFVANDILVVNNSSTDGTTEWLSKQSDLIIINQANTGSAGGQNTAFKFAKENNYDALWAMDDDVLPELDCLEILLQHYNENTIIAPLRFDKDGKIFLNETKQYNFSNPFKSLWKTIISKEDCNQELIEIEGPTFEGPLIPVNIIKKIGLPDKYFFIFGDDGEYFLRARKYNHITYLSTKSRMNRQLDAPNSEIQFTWKEYYAFRNIIILDILYSNKIVRIIRPILYLFKYLTKSKSLDNIKTSLRSFKDAYFYKQEIEY